MLAVLMVRQDCLDDSGLLDVLGTDHPWKYCGAASDNLGNAGNLDSQDTWINMPVSTHSSVLIYKISFIPLCTQHDPKGRHLGALHKHCRENKATVVPPVLLG